MHIRRFKFISFVLFIGLVGAAGYFYFSRQDKLIGIEQKLPVSVISVANIFGEGYLKFTHPERGFSVEYPQDLEVLKFDEGDGAETILFSRKENEHFPLLGKRGFQIFIMPFEELELTKDKILKDLPEAIIEELQEVVLGVNTAGGDIKALIFWSQSPVIDKTREVWFVHNSYLYEVTTYEHFDSELAKILSTWQFL